MDLYSASSSTHL